MNKLAQQAADVKTAKGSAGVPVIYTQPINGADGQYNLLLVKGERADAGEAEANFAEKNAKPGLVSDSPLFWMGYDAYFNRVSLAEMTCAEETQGWKAGRRDARAWRKAARAVYA